MTEDEKKRQLEQNRKFLWILMGIWFLTFLWMNSRMREAERHRQEQEAIQQEAGPGLSPEGVGLPVDDRIRVLRSVIERDPKSRAALEARQQIPQLLALRGRWQEAAQAWEDAAGKLGRGDEAVSARYRAGLIWGERVGDQKKMEKLLGGMIFETKRKAQVEPQTPAQTALRTLCKPLWRRAGYDVDRPQCTVGETPGTYALRQMAERLRASRAPDYLRPVRLPYDPEERVPVVASRAAGQRLDVVYKDRLRYKMMAALVGVFNPQKHPDYAHAGGVLLLALLVKLLLWPLNTRSYVSMKEMQLKTQAVQPQLEDLKRRYKDDQLKFMQEQNKLFKKQGISPMKGCLPMLIQMPILFAIYYAVRMYSFQFSHGSFLWVKDLSQPDLPLMLVYVGTMILTTKLQPTTATDKQQKQTQQMMTYLMPIMILFFFRSLPAAFILYWTAFNVLSTGQQVWLTRKYKHLLEAAAGKSAKPARPGKPARIVRKGTQAPDSGANSGADTSSRPPRRAGERSRNEESEARRKAQSDNTRSAS